MNLTLGQRVDSTSDTHPIHQVLLSAGLKKMPLSPHHDLPRVKAVDIGSIHLSDHAQVSLSMEITTIHTTLFQYKLNESLLQDSVTMAELIAELNHYFSENHTPDSPPMTVWEAHKQLNLGFFFY